MKNVHPGWSYRFGYYRAVLVQGPHWRLTARLTRLCPGLWSLAAHSRVAEWQPPARWESWGALDVFQVELKGRRGSSPSAAAARGSL